VRTHAAKPKTIEDVLQQVEAETGVEGLFIERNAIVMAATPVRQLSDGAPAIMQMLWERHGILPRNLILVEVKHPKVPYARDNQLCSDCFRP
jgi:KUP system potassium uptake protein